MSPKLLAERVQAVLTPELKEKEWKDHPHPLAGHCYAASEALWHLLGKVGYTPCVGRRGNVTHWWLRGPQGEILDPTAGQFDPPFDYTSGRGCGFLTRYPSSRARKIISRVLAHD